jgi:Arm DNA-binding domain
MSVKSRNGHLEYRFMYRGQIVFVSTGLADTTQNRKLVEAMEGAHRQEMIEGPRRNSPAERATV